MKVEATTYNHSELILQMFMHINKYNLMDGHAHSAETPEQMINLGLVIITKSNIFASDIRKWHSRPDANRTWQNFKTHFKEVQQAIRQSQPTIIMDSLGYHGQANATTIVDEIINKLTSQQITSSEATAEQQMQQALDHMANSTQHSESMAKQMQALATTISNLQTQVNQNQTRGHSGGGGGRCGGRRGHGGQNGRSGGQGNSNRGNNSSPHAYCWTHGNRPQVSRNCEGPAEDHIADAGYKNMQGGSTKNCHWLD
jgi:polyhydroxyalkanoate synthesis regulator phasin